MKLSDFRRWSFEQHHITIDCCTVLPQFNTMKSSVQKPKEASVKWVDANRKIFITALLNFSKGPISNLNNSKTGWSVEQRCRWLLWKDESELQQGKVDIPGVNNEEKLHHFDKFANNSGFGVDARGAVTGSLEALNAYRVKYLLPKRMESSL